MTILIIDDEAMIRTMAQKILSKAGYDVIVSDGGVSGIEKYARHAANIRLILLDWTMPDISGEETLRQLRSLSPGLSCIISSGHILSADAVPEDLRKHTHFLEKPYRSTELIDAVERALNTP